MVRVEIPARTAERRWLPRRCPGPARLWRLHLPDTAPIGDDVDIAFLAQQFKLSGGNIRNASLTGAFLAAEAGGVVSMRHLVRGVAYEYTKLGRLTLEAEFEGYLER